MKLRHQEKKDKDSKVKLKIEIECCQIIKKIECRNVNQKKINIQFWNIRNGCRIEKIKNQKLKIDGIGMQDKVS